jgi:hypothetical protein
LADSKVRWRRIVCRNQAGLGEDEAGSDAPVHPADAVLVVLRIGDGAP